MRAFIDVPRIHGKLSDELVASIGFQARRLVDSAGRLVS